MFQIHKPPHSSLRVIRTTESETVLLPCLSWPPHIASRGVVARRVVGHRARHLLSYTRQTKRFIGVDNQSSLFEQLEGARAPEQPPPPKCGTAQRGLFLTL